MTNVRRLVIDVLKPHDPPLVDFTQQTADVDGVEGVSASLIELDQEVQNVKLTFEGESLDVTAIEERIEELSGTVHSVDQVACGEFVVEEQWTHQDR
ncbi:MULTISPECIES: DUF211 domain-containing protein [Salinibaculum]|uniref:DUF211 domain-containing protein n=1 Tax=Salinibaculum TaxID=2732368 RepID=UPI0030D2586D